MTLLEKLELLNAAHERKIHGEDNSLDPLLDFSCSVCTVANKNLKNQEKVDLALEFITDDMLETRTYSPEIFENLMHQREALSMEKEQGFHI